MVKLYSFGPGFGVADPSPFVLKIDLYLRMAGIEFETIASAANLQKAPKGKLPFIEDEGDVIADSFFIMAYLNKKYNIDLDACLSEEQKALSHFVMKSIDEDAYWCLVYSRWMRDDTWPVIKAAFFDSMPFPLKYIIPIVAKKGVKNALIKQGLGRHSDEEIKQILNRSLASLSTMLGDKPYIWGDKMCALDATLFAFLSQFICVSIDNPFNDVAKGYDNLVQYCHRIQSEYYAS